MLHGFLEFVCADPAVMIRFHKQQNFLRESGLINLRSDGARLVLIARSQAKNPGNVDLRGRRVARQRDNRNADLVRDLLRLMRDIAVGRRNQRRNSLFADQLDHFAAGLSPLFRLVAHRERQVTPVRERPRGLFLRQRHVRGCQQRLAVRRICTPKRKEEPDLHRCALKIRGVVAPGSAISDAVAVESCIGSLRSDFVLGQQRNWGKRPWPEVTTLPIAPRMQPAAARNGSVFGSKRPGGTTAAIRALQPPRARRWARGVAPANRQISRPPLWPAQGERCCSRCSRTLRVHPRRHRTCRNTRGGRP